MQDALLQVEVELSKMQGMVESEDAANLLVFRCVTELQQHFVSLHKGDYSFIKGATPTDRRRVAATVWDILTEFDNEVSRPAPQTSQ